MQVFMDRLADILECDALAPETRFRDTGDWDSLKGFGILVLLENTYGRPMTVDAFLACETVADLARAAGLSETAG